MPAIYKKVFAFPLKHFIVNYIWIFIVTLAAISIAVFVPRKEKPIFGAIAYGTILSLIVFFLKLAFSGKIDFVLTLHVFSVTILLLGDGFILLKWYAHRKPIKRAK
jgi:hypothetical protein